MTANMKRREFITLLGRTAAAWPLAARAQQAPMPVVGFLSIGSREPSDFLMPPFRQGLREAGYVEDQNVKIEYRWAEDQDHRLPDLAADLVRRQVAVIAAAGGTAALAAKAATATIPIVFGTAFDPVELGLVASLNRPGGNLTGVTNLNAEVGPKRLELMHEMLPTATVFALLVDPHVGPAINDANSRNLQAAASTLGLKLHMLHASAERDLDGVFATLVEIRADALVIAPATFFSTRSEHLGALTVRHAVPAIYQFRPFATAGGLLSYGSSQREYYRLIGAYAGKILKGEKPADLPVQQATKVELIINLRTAKTLGITIPLSLLGRADEVIE
jgi:putative ABC transport system substrate-binding protein